MTRPSEIGFPVSDGLFADDGDMAFGIELGDVQCFDFFYGDAFGQFVDFFLRIYAFSWPPSTAVFEEVLGPVDEVGRVRQRRGW